jgi:hypothetical protein
MTTSAAALIRDADETALQEYQLKAGYLYNFTRFVEWPTNAFSRDAAPFSVCIFGEDPFGDLVERTMSQKRVGERRLAITRLRANDDPRGCHLLFFSESHLWQFAKVQAQIGQESVLTVGEGRDFTKRGGVVGMVMDEDRIQLEINVVAAGRARLRISSKLLSIVRVISEPTQAAKKKL